jgi:hypothetical protein
MLTPKLALYEIKLEEDEKTERDLAKGTKACFVLSLSNQSLHFTRKESES